MIVFFLLQTSFSAVSKQWNIHVSSDLWVFFPSGGRNRNDLHPSRSHDHYCTSPEAGGGGITYRKYYFCFFLKLFFFLLFQLYIRPIEKVSILLRRTLRAKSDQGVSRKWNILQDKLLIMLYCIASFKRYVITRSQCHVSYNTGLLLRIKTLLLG